MAKKKDGRNKISFSEWIKGFSKCGLREKIFIAIFILIAVYSIIIFVYTMFIFSSFSLNLVYTSYLQNLGIDFKTPLSTFGLIMIPLSIVFLLFYLSKKLNWYLALTVSLILFIGIFGLSFLNSSYSSDLPASIVWDVPNQVERNILVEEYACEFSRLECNSVREKTYYVAGDEIYCNFKIFNCSAVISDFRVSKVFLNVDEESEIPVSLTGEQVHFRFGIDRNLKAIWVHPALKLGDGRELFPLYIYWEFENVYSEEEYNSKQSEKNSFLITVLSLSIFSSIIAVSHLKKILEKSKED